MQLPYYSGEEIARTLSYRGLIEHLREGHRQPPPSVERVLMLQKTASGLENSFLIWPAWQHDHNLGIKITTIFPGNSGTVIPGVQAIYVLLDGRTGSPQALLDGTEMTYWKTAADSALSADYLARRDAKTFLMVGAGGLASHLIRAYQTIRPGLERILIWNRTAEKARKLVADWTDSPEPEPVVDLKSTIREADIVCCATTTFAPLIRGEWLMPGTHLDLIGSFTPEMREADDEAVRRARVFVDSRWFTIEYVGDLTQPIANSVISARDIEGDLFDLCKGARPGRISAEEITLFKSGGGAHLDLMTAQHVVGLFG